MSWERSRGRRTGLFLAALVLCAAIAFLWLQSTDVFSVKRVTATGTDRITKEQLADLTSALMGKSLLSVSTKGVKEELLALPYVESVDIVRAFPNTLEIKVVEYQPVARLRDGQGVSWLVSDGGIALKDTDPNSLADLPLLLSDTPVTALEGQELPASVVGVVPLAERLISGELGEKLPGIAWVRISTAGCASLVLQDGGELRLGAPEDLDQKLQVALDIVGRCVAEGRVIEYVDASVINRVAVKAR